jgi:hypothetical protein
MEAAYEGGGGVALVATPVTILPVMAVATPVTTMAPRGTTCVSWCPSVAAVEGVGLVGAHAVCSTGFCTWVDLTDCMMMGEWVFAWRALQACIELDLNRKTTVKLRIGTFFL